MMRNANAYQRAIDDLKIAGDLLSNTYPSMIDFEAANSSGIIRDRKFELATFRELHL